MRTTHTNLYTSTLATVAAGLYAWLALYGANPQSGSLLELQKLQEELESITSYQKISPPTTGVYLGAFADFESFEDNVTEEKITDFTTLIDKKIAWAYFSNNWINGINFPLDTVTLLNKLNVTPYIRIMPRTDFRQQPLDSPYTLQRIAAGEYDSELRLWARAARDSQMPLMIEFGTEVNGDWFPWNGKWNGVVYTASDQLTKHSGVDVFVTAYRHIIDLFEDEGVKNVTWVYHINAQSAPDQAWNDIEVYYPGDDYIDWIGVSVYGAQRVDDTWVDFDSVYRPAYTKIRSFTDRPIGIVELGVAEGPRARDKSTWIQSALASLEDGSYPATKAVSYWHSSWQDQDTLVNLKIDSSRWSATAFREAVRSNYFVATTSIISAQ